MLIVYIPEKNLIFKNRSFVISEFLSEDANNIKYIEPIKYQRLLTNETIKTTAEREKYDLNLLGKLRKIRESERDG